VVTRTQFGECLTDIKRLQEKTKYCLTFVLSLGMCMYVGKKGIGLFLLRYAFYLVIYFTKLALYVCNTRAETV
jgi:hypothetical protein